MTDEWRDNRQYVIHAIEELQRRNSMFSDQLTALKVDAAVQKTKILMWGSIASAIGAILGAVAVGLIMHYFGIK